MTRRHRATEPARPPADWIGGVLPWRGPPVNGEPDVDMVVWMASTGYLFMRAEPRGDDASLLAQGLALARGEPQAPAIRSVRVARPELAAQLASVAGPLVALQIAPTPELDARVAEFIAALNEEMLPAPVATLRDLAEREPQWIARFVRACADLARCTPWTCVERDIDVLVVRAQGLPWQERWVSIIGQSDVAFGWSIFETWEDYDDFIKSDPEEPSGRFKSVMLEDRGLAAPSTQRVYARGPLTLPPECPWIPFLAAGRGESGFSSDVTIDEIVEATLATEALARFFETHAASLRDDIDLPRCEPIRLKGPDGDDVTLTVHSAALSFPPRPGQPGDSFEERITFETLGAWTQEFRARHGDELRRTIDDIGAAFAGRRPTKRDRSPTSVIGTSLPLLCASLWRPLKSGGTGLDLLETRTKTGAAVPAVLARLRAARAVWGELIDLDIAGREGLVRSLHDNTEYRVAGMLDGQLQQFVRWSRVFAILIPREDGRWTFPSTFVASTVFNEVSHADLVARVRGALRVMSHPQDEIEHEDVNSLLLKHGGVAMAVLHRVADDAANRPQKKRYVVNTDGDRFEQHDGVLAFALHPDAVIAGLKGDPEFHADDEHAWSWMPAGGHAASGEGEPIGEIKYDDGIWAATANSSERWDRLLARIETATGERPRGVEVRRMQPWASDKSLAKEPGPDVLTLRITSSRVRSPEGGLESIDPRALLVEQRRRLLDESVPMLGGAPREVANTAEGRIAVESWLREMERLGEPAGKGPRWLDADGLREEMGMERVGRRG